MSKMSPRLKQANKQEKTKQKKKSIKRHNKVNQADLVTVSNYFSRFNFINDTVFAKIIIIINAKRTIIKQQQQNA